MQFDLRDAIVFRQGIFYLSTSTCHNKINVYVIRLCNFCPHIQQNDPHQEHEMHTYVYNVISYCFYMQVFPYIQESLKRKAIKWWCTASRFIAGITYATLITCAFLASDRTGLFSY